MHMHVQCTCTCVPGIYNAVHKTTCIYNVHVQSCISVHSSIPTCVVRVLMCWSGGVGVLSRGSVCSGRESHGTEDWSQRAPIHCGMGDVVHCIHDIVQYASKNPWVKVG